jgi:hypothetical protein
MAYKWDVFLSYVHERPCGPWVNDYFLPLLNWHLGEELGHRPSIFFDRNGLHAGDQWPDALKHALLHSRCLVGVWSAHYFQSRWCLNECAVILHRQNQLGLGTGQNPSGLVVPVKVGDGVHFPPYASNTQYANMERFFSDSPAFRSTSLYIELEQAVREFAPDVARAVCAAPNWDPAWGTPQWLDAVVAGVAVPPRPVVAQPVIR